MTPYERTKAWRLANPDGRRREYQARKARAAADPDYAARQKAIHKRAALRYRAAHGDELRPVEAHQARIKRAADPDGQKDRYARWRAKREAALAATAGRPRASSCDICAEVGKTVFDHCHTRGHFRGWLCDRCNRTLGQVKDSPGLLRKMIRYLETSDGETIGGVEKRAA